MGYNYGGYSPVPSAFGGLGQVFSNVAQSAAAWMPLMTELMKTRDESAWKGLQVALQSPDENVRRAAIEDYEKVKSPFRIPWPKVTVPGQITTPAQPAVPAIPGVPPAPQDINAPGGTIAGPVGAQAAVPAVPEVRAPSTQQYWVPPVAFGERTVGEILAGNPALANLPETIKNARWADLPPAMQDELGKYFTAPFVWGGLGSPTAPAAPGGPAAPGMSTDPGFSKPVPSGPSTDPGFYRPTPAVPVGPAGATPPQPQPPAQPGGPGQPTAARVNPAIVAGARGKNIGQLSAADVLETRGVPLTPEEETEFSAIPITNFSSPLQLETFLNQRRAQSAQIRSETATAGLREAETAGARSTQAAQTAARTEDFYTNKAFSIMFGDPQNAPARLTQLYAQAQAHGVQPDILRAGAMQLMQKAQAGQTVPIHVPGPDGKPITVYMTGPEYKRSLQEDERLAIERGRTAGETLLRIKAQMVDRAAKQFGPDTSKWPDDVRVIMGFDPKPTSPQAIRNLAISAAKTDTRWLLIAPDDPEAQQKRLALIDEFIVYYTPPKPVTPGTESPGTPGSAGAPGTTGAKPPSGPIDPKVAAIARELQGPVGRITGDIGAWVQSTFGGGERPPTLDPGEAMKLARLARVWPTLTPVQRTQLQTVAKIPPSWIPWLDKRAGRAPAATPAGATPGTAQPGQGPAKPGAGRQLTMAAIQQQAAQAGISVAQAIAQAKEDGYVIIP